VDDTPPQEWDNGGCPDFPRNANNQCGSDEDGEMFMNYMDYVDDACMVMFTNGQKKRMRDAIDTYRPKLLETPACSNVSVMERSSANNHWLHVYPNPGNGLFTLETQMPNNLPTEIIILNALGQTVYHTSISNAESDSKQILHLEHLVNGVYTLVWTNEHRTLTQQIAISK